MLRWRLILGVLLVGGLFGLCWLDARAEIPGAWLMILALVVAVLASGELIAMLRKNGLQPHAGVIYVTNVAIVLASWLPFVVNHLKGASNLGSEWLAQRYEVYANLHPNGQQAELVPAVFALGMVAALLTEMRRYEKPGGITQRLGLTAFCLAYVGLLLACVIWLRLAYFGRHGMLALVSVVMIVKMCDIGAYTAGRLFGRHKMTPILSPGKTWEGAVGGIVFGCFASWLTLVVLSPSLIPEPAQVTTMVNSLAWLPYGLLISVTGILGDLAESLLKRDLGCKDSSTWMPGFGGVLDIMDSILFAAPVAYLCWTLGLMGSIVP